MIDFLLGVPGKLKTIIDHLNANLSPTRAGKIDNLDAAISTRAPSSTALSTANYTAARAGYLDNLAFGISPIKSIQSLEIYLGANQTSNTATITAVNTGKAVLLYRGTRTSGGDLDASNLTATLSNSTTVTATRMAASPSTGAYIAFTIVEFI